MIVKHNNPCGVAIAETARARRTSRRFACDPLSAFGGVIVFNRPVDAALAERLHQQFIEVLLAPGFEPEALEVLTQKEAIRILEADGAASTTTPRERDVKRVARRPAGPGPRPGRRGARVDERARPTPSRARTQWADLLFAWKVCRHVRSNAIVFAKDGATLGIGAGQMSRVDSVRIAIDKAREALGDRRRGAARRLGGRLGRVLPLPRRARDRDPARARRAADPARRLEARRRGDRRLRRRRRGDGASPAAATSATDGRRARARRGDPARRCASSAPPTASGGNPLGVFLDGAEVPRGRAPGGRRATSASPRRCSSTTASAASCASSPPRSSCRSRATRWSARRGCCASRVRAVSVLRPPAGEVPVRVRRRARRGSRPTPSGGRRSSSSRSARRPRSTRSTARPTGYGLVGVWAWIDEDAGLVRERVFVPEAGIDEDEATGLGGAAPVRAARARDRDPPGPRLGARGPSARPRPGGGRRPGGARRGQGLSGGGGCFVIAGRSAGVGVDPARAAAEDRALGDAGACAARARSRRSRRAPRSRRWRRR